MANSIMELFSSLNRQGKTVVVVTHDMRLAKKLASRVVFLHEATVLFFGTYPEMEKCAEPIVQEFLTLDVLQILV